MAYLKTDQATLYYEYHPGGSGHPVVLINSLGTGCTIWSGVVRALGGRCPVLLSDKRGHGLSQASSGKVTIDDYADDIIALMDHLGIRRTHVVGLSIGGLITYSLASRYPDRFGKLVFSNTGSRIGSAASWDERIAAIRKDGLGALAPSIVERWLSPGYRRANPAVVSGMVTMLERCSAPGYIQACEAIREADYSGVLKKIEHPALFLGGGADPGTTPEFVRNQAADLGADRVHILEGVGHLPGVEEPGRVAAILLEFFKEDTGTLYERGMQTRREVLGDAHVDRAEAAKTEFDTDFQAYIVNNAWGSIWSRPGLTRRERSLLTLALLAALGHTEELEMHIRACANTGASPEDIREVLLHTGVYAGVPVTNQAMKIAKQILTDQNENDG